MNKSHKIVVLGGSSGIGLEVARRGLADGALVVIVGRSHRRLDFARQSLGHTERLETISTDIGERDQVARLFERVGSLDHLVVTAADLAYGPARSLQEADLLRSLRSKFLGPFFAAQEAAPRIGPDGSITLTSGIAAHRPRPGGALTAAVNGALEAMGRALAIELAPVRVNVVSPGWVDTPIWDQLAGITPLGKQQAFDELAARIPAGRIGQSTDIADAISMLMRNAFITGTVLHVDGGQRLV